MVKIISIFIVLISIISCTNNKSEIRTLVQEIIANPDSMKIICNSDPFHITDSFKKELSDPLTIGIYVKYFSAFKGNYEEYGLIEGVNKLDSTYVVSYYIGSILDSIPAEFMFIRIDTAWYLEYIKLSDYDMSRLDLFPRDS